MLYCGECCGHRLYYTGVTTGNCTYDCVVRYGGVCALQFEEWKGASGRRLGGARVHHREQRMKKMGKEAVRNQRSGKWGSVETRVVS